MSYPSLTKILQFNFDIYQKYGFSSIPLWFRLHQCLKPLLKTFCSISIVVLTYSTLEHLPCLAVFKVLTYACSFNFLSAFLTIPTLLHTRVTHKTCSWSQIYQGADVLDAAVWLFSHAPMIGSQAWDTRLDVGNSETHKHTKECGWKGMSGVMSKMGEREATKLHAQYEPGTLPGAR